ncbi:MAG: 50S ribosomal protein L29 [Saprospiraceae bacterium]|nr:MAG: 50S ribosomal protein L29 [Bacteroidetes bacterium OLB9]MCO6464461.1 50S ribosomal protein L29 [Saprospiraceae bacterium]MCZ2338623.1 50S ribosomal protein L29 [Chitinophagales bacterium]
MASKKYSELQNLTVDTLKEELGQARENLNRIKFDHGARGLENPGEIQSVKKEIAHLLTELRAREINDMTPEELSKRSRIRLRRK